MKVEFTFTKDLVDYKNYDIADIHNTIKKEFAKRGLLCIAEGEVLAFSDTGGKDDFSYMWLVISSLMKSKWFIECASSCMFFDDDGTYEDVLAQLSKYKEYS